MSVPSGPPADSAQPSSSPDQWRPSESDRQAISDRLRVAVDEGRLDLTEYDRRLRAADSVETVAELHQLLADLPQPTLLQLGDITVTATAVHTPGGVIPLRGAQWSIYDQWRAEQKIPTWAIVLAIVGFFCITIFSLLFLLAKETRYVGTVDVLVQHGAQRHVTRIPVHSHQQVHHIYQQVNYLRSLTNG